MTPRLLALASLALLAACGGPQPQRPQTTAERRDCATTPILLSNASRQAVEQLYIGTPGNWGADRLGNSELAPRATLNLPRPGNGRFNLRAVWVNGQAAEFPNLDGCVVTRIEIADTGMRAQ